VRQLYKLAILMSLVLAWTTPLQADYRNPDPKAACALLKGKGLGARTGYVAIGEGVHRCSSHPRTLMAGGAVMDSIRFYATGTSDEVTSLTLQLNVRSRAETQRAHLYLLQYTEALVKNALGQEVPKGVQDAILAGTDGRWQVADAEVLVGKAQIRLTGYELLVNIR